MRRVSLLRQMYKNFSSSTDSVLYSQDKLLVKVVLNKPKALNAIDLPMIRSL